MQSLKLRLVRFHLIWGALCATHAALILSILSPQSSYISEPQNAFLRDFVTPPSSLPPQKDKASKCRSNNSLGDYNMEGFNAGSYSLGGYCVAGYNFGGFNVGGTVTCAMLMLTKYSFDAN